MKLLYLDCMSGISGDMTVGALIDAGADFGAVRAGLVSLGVPGFCVTAARVVKRGVTATRFQVDEDGGGGHVHRHLGHIMDIIRNGQLPDPVKEKSIAVFRRIADAEAAVHGIPVEQVHFHEVGAIDSIADIVAANLALHLLGVGRVVVSKINAGGGTVRCAHGIMPVPAPATALLLAGAPVYGTDGTGELTTPTGAALAAEWADAFGPMPEMTVTAVGHGAGAKDLPDRANVLRAVIGDAAGTAAAENLPGTPGMVTVMETLVDDMTGEMLAPAMEALLAAGALDVFAAPVTGKKGRPAHLLTVLCAPGGETETARLLFDHTTTLGVRFREERRITLGREWRAVETPFGPVRVKIGLRADGAPPLYHPEHDSCREAARLSGAPVRRIAEAALAAALEGRWINE